jgi:PAS domain-containing protein
MSDTDSGQPMKAKDSPGFAESVVDTVREPLVILDPQLRVKYANRSFYRTFGNERVKGTHPERVKGTHLGSLR